MTELQVTSGIDTLSANEFAVFLDGEAVHGVFTISGLAPFKLDVTPALIKLARSPLTLSKMVHKDPALPVNRWLRESAAAKDDVVRPLRTLDIVAMDEGQESRRWSVIGAWVSEIAYADFDSGSGELMQEKLVIQYDRIDTLWPAADEG